MSLVSALSIHETAFIAGVPKTTVEKAIEKNVITPFRHPDPVRGGRGTRHLGVNAVVYFAILKNAELDSWSVENKKRLWRCVHEVDARKLKPISPTAGMTLDIQWLASKPAKFALRYEKERTKFLESNDRVLGGTTVIKGTRLSVYSVADRLKAGETLDDLAADYPNIPKKAFETANVYARTHPLRGRPSGKPWKNQAPTNSGSPRDV